MLEELAKKDSLWRTIAFNICKDRMLADDIVQEMYLRFNRNPKEYATDGYVAFVISSVYLNYLKKLNDISLSEFYYLECHDKPFEPTDKQQEILDKLEDIEWWKLELIDESYDRSYREIAKVLNVNYGFIYRSITNATKEILGDDYDELYYNNRIKYKKPFKK